MEAPPGFEPGMEVLQTGPDCLSCCSSCLLVGPDPSFSPVFGRKCSQLVPNFDRADARARSRVFAPIGPFSPRVAARIQRRVTTVLFASRIRLVCAPVH
jgi:hypothetical protein